MPDISDVRAFATMLHSMGKTNPLGAEENPRDVYSNCWCLSGKKWKFCHKERAQQKQSAFGARHTRLLEEFRAGICLHPSASPESCSTHSKPIRSHAVQRRGGLASIAVGGHVYSPKKGYIEIAKNDGEVTPKLVGVGDASTFPGFCSHHDTEMFRPVEQVDSKLDRWNAFLLSFRAVAYELATAATTLRCFPRLREEADRGQPYGKQVEIQTFWHFQEQLKRVAMQAISRWKQEYDTGYLRHDLSSFRSYAVSFDTALPFVAAGAFMPAYDFAGKPLHMLGDQLTPDHVALNVTVLGGKTVAVFGWTGSGKGPAANYVETFASLPVVEKANAILLIALEHLENVFLNPSWYDALSPEMCSLLQNKLGSGMRPRATSAPSEPELRLLNAILVDVRDDR